MYAIVSSGLKVRWYIFSHYSSTVLEISVALRCTLITVCSFAEGDSENYIAYYRRATVYLAMGKSKAAIRDLSKVVELKQDFTSVSITGTEDCSSVKKKQQNCFKEGLGFFSDFAQQE